MLIQARRARSKEFPKLKSSPSSPGASLRQTIPIYFGLSKRRKKDKSANQIQKDRSWGTIRWVVRYHR